MDLGSRPAHRPSGIGQMLEEPSGSSGRRDRARDLLPARSSVGQRSTNPGRRDGNMRVCCGLISHLELARRPDLYGTPVIVGRWDEHVVAASDDAQAFGVLAGMALRQAEHLCPQATFVLPDEEAVVRIRELVSAALYDLAPIVEVRDEGIAWLDLSGVMNPGQSIHAARHRLLKAIGREPRLGLAPGPFSARLAAARARPGRLLRVADAREFLAPLPSRELPLDAEQLERLDLLGLRTLGAVAAIGPRQLESQLGPEGPRPVPLARG